MTIEQEMPPPTLRTMAQSFRRAIGMLEPERRVAITTAIAAVAAAGLQVVEPVLFGQAINTLSLGWDALPYVVLWGVVSFAAFVAAMLIALTADRMTHRRRLAAMATYLEHVLALPASFHSKAQSGRLMRVMIAGCEALFAIWLPLFREQLSNAVSFVVLVPIAFWMNWRLALLLVALMAVYATVNTLVIRHTSGGQSRIETQFTSISGQVGDLFGNVSVLQSFLAVTSEMRSVRHSLQRLLAAQYPILNWWAAMAVLTRGASSISIVAIFGLGALLVERGEGTIGEIVAFVGFASLVIGRLDQTTNFAMGMFMRAPALAQFFAVLDERAEIVDRAGARPLVLRGGHVVFERVTFRYPRGSGAVHELDFEARPGETVAIVGPTGSGKTTALALLQRAYDPESGRILIDGQDVRDVTLASLRGAIGVVFQEAGLFSRSIAENIAIGKPGAAPQEVEEAARLAGAHDFILRKERGYATVVGERGQGLSGGERQRIAVARALLKNAPILVLDEATSALDTATETRLQQALDALRRGRTTFVIAHRLSTVRGADRIIVLDAGRIVEQGSFDELVRRDGVFAALVREGGISAVNTHQPTREELTPSPHPLFSP